MNVHSSSIATRAEFDDVVLPHLSSAYQLARRLTRNNHDAQDIVQEASLRAFRHFDQYRGGDARAWLLTIVRNTSYGWYRKNRPAQRSETLHEHLDIQAEELDAPDPERLMLQRADTKLVGEAIASLPGRFREVLVLRELEGLSYKEIADAMGVPLGTVMSSLARARGRFREAVTRLLAHRPTIAAVALLAGIVGVCVPARTQAAAAVRAEANGTPRFKAIAFDYFVLFNPDSVVPEAERAFPGKGRELTNLWRTRQFEYGWLRSITNRYEDFLSVTDDALVYAANARHLELTPAIRRHLLDTYLHLTPWPDAAAGLRRLKAAGTGKAARTK